MSPKKKSSGNQQGGLFRSTGRFLLGILVGANVVSVVLLLLCGYSTMFHPKVCSILVGFGLTFPVYLVVCLFFLVFWAIFSARFIWISIVGLVAGFGFIRTYCPINLPDPHPQGCIKVLSYNVKGFCIADRRSDAAEQFRRILDYLRKSQADIVCLQEYQYWPDQLGRQVEEVRNRWPYHDSLQLGTNAIGFWSRYPIIKRGRIRFSSTAHGSVAYTLRLGASDTIIVINNHFVSNAISAEDKSLYKNMVKTPSEVNMKSNMGYFVRKVGRAGLRRSDQADSVASYVERHADKPIILCGDLNDSPIAYAHHRLTRSLNDAYVSSGFGPGISYHEAGMYFRLDNILCSHHWKSYTATVDAEMDASDHYPIFCFLKKD